jgi:hypothetical protein
VDSSFRLAASLSSTCAPQQPSPRNERSNQMRGDAMTVSAGRALPESAQALHNRAALTG